MARLTYDELETTEVGKALVGEIQDGRAKLAWSLKDEGVEALELMIFHVDQEPISIALSPAPTGEGVAEHEVPLQLAGVVSAMCLVATVGRKKLRLAHDPEGFFLHRVLARNLADVNRDLRWAGRITHLDTRFFAVRNTLPVVDYDLQARCLVSVGYQGIEQDRRDIIDWAEAFCQDTLAQMRETENVEVRSSVLAFWVHLAIWREDVAEMLQIADLIVESLEGLAEYPVGTVNALHSTLLVGSFLVNVGKKAEAVEVFKPFDRYYRIAAHKYPRALVNYRELIGVAKCTYLCKLGFDVARDVKSRAGGSAAPKLTPNAAWNDGNRLRDKAACAEAGKRYARMISAAA